jgi:hypothetical protein
VLLIPVPDNRLLTPLANAKGWNPDTLGGPRIGSADHHVEAHDACNEVEPVKVLSKNGVLDVDAGPRVESYPTKPSDQRAGSVIRSAIKRSLEQRRDLPARLRVQFAG